MNAQSSYCLSNSRIRERRSSSFSEIKWIKDLIKRNPHITLNEIWYKLKINKGYTRKPASLYRYYGYKTEEIQTDNGVEFTFNRSDVKREYPMDTLLNELGIKHYKIRPRTPEHNGKVERSHRNDNERFYSYLKFYSLEDLRKQGAAYLKRSNRIPMAVLGYLTSKEKREELERA